MLYLRTKLVSFFGPGPGGELFRSTWKWPALRALTWLSVVFASAQVTATAGVVEKDTNYSIASSDCGGTVQLDAGADGLFTLRIPSPKAANMVAGCRVTAVNADSRRGKLLSGAPAGLPALLFPREAFIIEVNAAGTGWNVIVGPGRWLAPAGTVFYVDSAAGNDGNDGLAPGSGAAWATPQHAVDVLKQSVDFGLTRDGPVIVQFADGVYSSSVGSGIWVNGPFPGAATSNVNINAESCPVVFKGNPTDPSAVIVSSTASDAVTGIGGAFFCIQDMELANALSADLAAGGASVIRFGNLILGRSGNAKIRSGHGSAIENYSGTTIHLTGDSSSVFWGLVDGNIYITQANINIDSDFSVDAFVLSQSGGGLFYKRNTVVGSGVVSGAKFSIDSGGYIYTETNDVNIFPGNFPGKFGGGYYDSRSTP